MIRVLLVVAILSSAAACGGDDGGTALPPDAPVDAVPTPQPDAAPSMVPSVSCTGVPIALTVSIIEPPPYRFGFSPAPQGDTPTIKAGDVVKFVMPRNHNAVSGAIAGTPDGRFLAPIARETCFRFTDAGRYGFYCEAHEDQAFLEVTAN